MRDQFLEQAGGGHGFPEGSTGEGGARVPIYQRVARRVLDKDDEAIGGDRNGGKPGDDQFDAEEQRRPGVARSWAWPWVAAALAVTLAVVAWIGFSYRQGGRTAATMPPAQVTVSKPLVRDVDTRIGLLGQFSAIDRVELRAQVGGTLTEIHFKDGQIVHKGDLLFVIDPRPYEIRLEQAKAALQTATARMALSTNQLSRATSLKRSDFATQETVDQRTNDQDASQAAVEDAKARVRDAELDLDYSKVRAPFTGRIGARQVSIGSLIAGSRAATSPTTLLETVVSLAPLYMECD